MEHELLEEACDTVANAIDELKGEVSVIRLGVMIHTVLEDLEFERSEFLEMFENIYLCSPTQYAKNSAEDNVWAQEHDTFDVEPELFESDTWTADEAEQFGITVIDDEEII